MSFEYVESDYLGAPPQAQLGVLPLIPLFLLASGSLATVTISGWLSNDWSVGEYNNIAREMNDTIKAWDKIGWEKGCWKANPEKRKEWVLFWSRFSAHFKNHGIQSAYLTDSAEKPLRNSLLPQLRVWGEWLNKTCSAATGAPGPVEPPAPPSTDWGKVVMWGAAAVGAVALASMLKTTKDLFRG